MVTAFVGCGSDDDLAEAVYMADCEGVSARVWIPINEPRSVGTYRAEVAWGGGVSDRTEAERDGMISGVWLADLVGDPSPELVVAMSSAGSGSYGSVHVHGRTGDGLVRVPVGALGDGAPEGYMGHDTFEVAGGRLTRSHPVYLEEDPNAAPSGGDVSYWYSFSDSLWVIEAIGDSTE
jgi:hypothetical protein